MDNTITGTILPLMITLNSTDGSMLKLMTTSTEHSVSIKLMVSMDQQTVDST